MERCAKVRTQNANECLNGEIWRRCPKTQWHGEHAVTVSATMALMFFTSGRTEVFKVLKYFGLLVGEKSLLHAKVKDEHRLKRKNRKSVRFTFFRSCLVSYS